MYNYAGNLIRRDGHLRVREYRKMNALIVKMRILRDTRGQDLIEYALMAGFVAVAAGAIMPNVSTSISTIFSQVASVMSQAAGS